MCIFQYETTYLTYLLPLGLVSTEAFLLRVICQLWWLVKLGHVSVLRLRSHKWLKRFLLERSATSEFFQTASLSASCLASNLSGKLQILFDPKTLTGTSCKEKICMKFGLFMCQTNMPCRVFCFTLCNFERENKLKIYMRIYSKKVKPVDEAGD